MRRALGTVRTMRHSAASGFADFARMFTWRTWSSAWLGRVIMQVLFFALIGRLLGDAEAVRFLLIGNAVMIAASESLMTVASTTWERRAGTLPLLVASPTSPLVVFIGRSVQWVASGATSATVAFFVVAAVFGVDLPWPQALLVPVLIAAVSVAAYLFGSFLGALVLRAMDARNVVSNIAIWSMMAICGVNVPADFWPRGIQVIASVLPVTHGLQAIRDLLDGAAAIVVLRGVGLELLVGAGWLLLALLSIKRLVDNGRRTGTIEYAS
jgi:ABC-2 type transport system permease protein